MTTGNIETYSNVTELPTKKTELSSGEGEMTPGGIVVTSGKPEVPVDIETFSDVTELPTEKPEVLSSEGEETSDAMYAGITSTEAEPELSSGEEEMSRDVEISSGAVETSLGESELPTMKPELFSGEGKTTSGDIQASSGETDLSTEKPQFTPGEGEMTLGDVETTTGETEIPTKKTDLPSGEGKMTLGDVETFSGESELSTEKPELSSGEGEISSGDIDIPGQTELPIEESELISEDGEMLLGEKVITSSDREMTSGDIKIVLGEGETTPGYVKIMSGDGEMSSGDVETVSGDLEMATDVTIISDGGEMASGDSEIPLETVLTISGEGEISSGEEEWPTSDVVTTSQNTEMSSDVVTTSQNSEMPSDVSTTPEFVSKTTTSQLLLTKAWERGSTVMPRTTKRILTKQWEKLTKAWEKSTGSDATTTVSYETPVGTEVSTQSSKPTDILIPKIETHKVETATLKTKVVPTQYPTQIGVSEMLESKAESVGTTITPTQKKESKTTLSPNIITDTSTTKSNGTDGPHLEIKTHKVETLTLKPLTHLAEKTSTSPVISTDKRHKPTVKIPSPVSTTLQEKGTSIISTATTPQPRNTGKSTVDDILFELSKSTKSPATSTQPNFYSTLSTLAFDTIRTTLKDDTTTDVKYPVKTNLPSTRDTDHKIEIVTKKPAISEAIHRPATIKPTERTKLWYTLTTVDGIFPQSTGSTDPERLTKWPITQKPEIDRGASLSLENREDIVSVYPAGVAPAEYSGEVTHAKLTVYKVVFDVLQVSDETATEAYRRSRQMLRMTLVELAQLLRHAVRGVVDVVYTLPKPGVDDYSAKLTLALQEQYK